MKPAFAAALSGALLVAALANAATPPGGGSPARPPARQCFSASSISGFSPAGDEALNLRVGVNDVYHLTLFGACEDLDWNYALGVRTRTGGSFICDGMDVDIISRTTLGPRTCPVSTIRKLTPEEVAALPPKQRP